MTESWAERGPRLALWDEAFAPDVDGQSGLQRALDSIIAEVAGEHGQQIVKKVHDPDDEGETAIEYHVQPLGVEVWLYPYGITASDEEGEKWLHEESWDLHERWSVPDDFIADFRPLFASFLTDGDYTPEHLREVSRGEKFGDLAGQFGCLAALVLLWFAFCAAV